MAEQPIITEVEASEQTVAAVRDAMPVGVSGAPIDRLPLSPQLQQMAGAGVYTKRIASTDRCIRVVDVPLKGGGTAQFHCSRACVRLGDMQLCPEHDRAAFAPQQSPVAKGRVINSDSVTLSRGEEEEIRKISKGFDVPRPAPSAPASSAGSLNPQTGSILQSCQEKRDAAEPHHDLRVYFTLEELSSRDVLAVIKEKIVESLDGLPCRNVREMKQIVALQEKIAKLSKGGKRNGRGTEATDSSDRHAN